VQFDASPQLQNFLTRNYTGIFEMQARRFLLSAAAAGAAKIKEKLRKTCLQTV
jgi:hypothetical protein